MGLQNAEIGLREARYQLWVRDRTIQGPYCQDTALCWATHNLEPTKKSNIASQLLWIVRFRHFGRLKSQAVGPWSKRASISQQLVSLRQAYKNNGNLRHAHTCWHPRLRQAKVPLTDNRAARVGAFRAKHDRLRIEAETALIWARTPHQGWAGDVDGPWWRVHA